MSEGQRCASCGREARPDDRFCGGCGSPLTVTPTARRVLRPALNEVFAHLRSGEQRPATILMTDVSGFSTLGEHADPEWLFHLINEVFAELVECLVAHGAHIDKYVGDEVMALFGVPVAQERSVERAVRAALAMRERLQVLNAEGRFGAAALGIHTAINVGPVMVGPVGHQAYADYTVIGDAVNVTKRLEDEAPEGEIYVTQAVRDAAAEGFDFEPVRSYTPAGRRGEVRIFRVVGARRTAGRRPTDESAEAPLIGRESELRVVGGCAEAAASGVRTCAYVVGPPGIGKSRLLRDWSRSGSGRGFRIVSTACHAFSEHFPFLPLTEVVAQLVGLHFEGWPPRVTGDVERALEGLALEPRHRERLAALLGSLESPPEEPDSGWCRAVFEAIAALLHRATEAGPLCLVLEDIQWLDETSRSVIADLLAPPRPWPLLALVSSREPPGEWLPEELQPTVLELAPLPRPAMERLVQAWAAPDLLPAEMVRAICARAQGHPYFARELVHSLRRRAGTEAGADASLPHTLQELFLSQLDRLALPVRRLVQAASILGEPLSSPVLEAAMGGDPPLTTPLLAEATQQGLLRVGSAPGQFLFARRLLFEAAYATIPTTQRRDMHARIATYLTHRLEALGEAAVHAAAHHAYLGFGDERALELLLRSARQYRAQYANRQAIRDAGCAVEVISSLPHPDEFLEQRLEALWFLAQSYEIVGDLERAEGTLAEAEIYAEDSPNREPAAQIALSAATLCLMQGHWREAGERFARAREMWEQLGNEARVGHALLGMGLCAGAGGNTARAVALFTEAAARGGEALWVKAAALNNAGVVLLHDGRYREAEPYLREGLSANEQEGDRRGIAHSKASLGELSYRLARLEEARRWLDASIAEAAEIEDTQCRTLAALLLSRVHVLEGRAEAAREALATAPPPGPADDPEIEAMRRLADRDAALGVGEAASCPPLETPQEECERSAACRNAQAEALCLEIEAALRRGDRAVAEERRAALEELRFQASDRHLRRYAEWLLRVAELGEAAGMLPASVDGEASMFDVRGRRLREGWAAGPPTSP